MLGRKRLAITTRWFLSELIVHTNDDGDDCVKHNGEEEMRHNLKDWCMTSL